MMQTNTSSIGKLSGKSAYFKVWSVIILCCLGVIIYSNTFNSSFHFDDDNSIISNLNIINIRNLKAIWDFWPTRFITYLSVALNYHFGQLRVFGYHLFNLIVHLCTAIVVWWFIVLTFSTPLMRDRKIARHDNLIALFVGLVFVAHPIQTQGVTYIIQRATSLATFFYLASLNLYIKSRLLEQQKQALGIRRFYYVGSLVIALMAMFAKEMAISLPYMFLLYEHYFLKTKNSINWKRIVPFFIVTLIIPLTMMATKSVNFVEIRRVSEAGPTLSIGQYLLTQFKVMVTYLRLLLIPLNQNLDYDYPASKSLMELPTLASLFLLVVILVIARRIFYRYRLISFGISCFFLTLLPESSIMPIRDVIYEHRLYLPMLGYGLFLVGIAYYNFENKSLKAMVAIMVMIISCYSILTYNRNFVWKDEITLWSDTICKSPRKARPYNNRGLTYQNQGKIKLALSDFNRAMQVDPKYVLPYINRGLIYQNQGKLDLALPDFNKAIQLNPKFALPYNNRGLNYQKQGRLDLALSDYNRAIQLNPSFDSAYSNRGNVYRDKSDFEQAISDYNRAIQLNPNFALAYNNRGLAYQKQGKLDLALSDYNKAIQLNPSFDSAYSNRGNVYQDKSDFEQAISDYNRAIQLNPNFALAYNNRGFAYQNQGKLDLALSDYNRAIQLNLNLVLAYHNRAAAYFLKQEYDKSWEDVYKLKALGHKASSEFLEKLKKASGRE